MGLWILFCLLQYGLATTVLLLDRYQFSSKDNMMSPSTTFPTTGHVGPDTILWYLQSWIMVDTADSNICLLTVSHSDSAKVCLESSQFTVHFKTSSFVIPTVQFELKKWFFIEFGSNNQGFYASIRLRDGTLYNGPGPLSTFPLKDISSIKYPDDPLPINYHVRTT